LASATAFLYSGASPIQTGVSPGTIDVKRAAVLRGQITDRSNSPLSGVTVTIHNHSEFGQTLSRTDGMFDMAVNGGGLLTVNYTKDGYLPVQRQIDTPWADYGIADTVVMIPLDSQVTTVDLTDTTQAFQVAQGSPVTDIDGTRQATMLFPQGTSATMTLPDGSTQALTTLNVRASEYTVGDNGPQAMPGELPATSAYTYAVELSVDEAIAAGATRVDFDQPIPFYVDNFLNFPVGEIVPAGWYDREKVAWIPSDNGRIIGILAITVGMADIDVDGTGIAADATQLADLGITDAERERLAGLYAVGKSFWRAPIIHFTPWDLNWGINPPGDATQSPPPTDDSTPDEDQDDCAGCIIQAQSQSLGEELSIAGTPFNLRYQSELMPSNVAGRTLTIPITGSIVPASLQSVELIIELAGQVFKQSFSAVPNQTYTYVWNGKDVYGRPGNTITATIKVGMVYDGVYQQTTRFGYRGNGTPITGDRARREITLWRQWKRGLAGISAAPHLSSSALGNWGLDIHHAYAPESNTLFRGDGSVRDAQSMSDVITTVAGSGNNGFAGDGGPADQAWLETPNGVAIGSDGSLYISDSANYRVRRVTPDGIISTVVGTGEQGYSGDGGLAELAQLSNPTDISVAPDGSLYIADFSSSSIRHVTPDGIISTVAGTGVGGFSGDGGPANLAQLAAPISVISGSGGSLYIADTYNHRIRRVSADGIITTVAGTGIAGFSGDGGPAINAMLWEPSDIALGLDGSIYISERKNHRIRRVTLDGIITTVAGTGSRGFSGDGGAASMAQLFGPSGIALSLGGDLYIADTGNSRIRRMTPNGMITTIAGTSNWGYFGDGGPANQAWFTDAVDVSIAPDGSIYISDQYNSRIRRVWVAQATVGNNEYLVPSSSGKRLFYFDANGRHLRTLDVVTNAVLYQFRYDTDGRLSEIEDVDGNITRIERSGATPTAIVAPDGQRTTLLLDMNGYLNVVTEPSGEQYLMAYTSDGLMTSFTDRNGNNSNYTFDTGGRLVQDVNAIGGGWLLNRTDLANGYAVDMTSGENRVNSFQVERLSNGIRRHTNTARNGSISVIDYSNAVTTTTSPDGTVSIVTEGPDPRFGMQSPVPQKASVVMPSGLNRSVLRDRQSTLADATDLLSHTNLTETITVNGKVTVSNFDTATQTTTLTTPESRTLTRVLNAQGKIATMQADGLAAINYAYDPRGRLSDIDVGTGVDARNVQLTYDLNGYLDSLIDPMNRVTTFERDLLGRTTRQTMPDGRAINFTYDPNGNLTSLTPPGRIAHVFNYTAGDQKDIYTPPTLTDVALPATNYTYNLDKQLTSVTRSRGQTR